MPLEVATYLGHDPFNKSLSESGRGGEFSALLWRRDCAIFSAIYLHAHHSSNTSDMPAALRHLVEIIVESIADEISSRR